MDFFKLYAKDFKRLIDAVFETYKGRPPKDTRKDINGLIFEVKSFSRLSHRLFSIEKQDLEQELYLMWVEYFKSYKENNPSTTLRQYLIRRSVWGLRDKVKKWKHIPRCSYTGSLPKEEYSFKLDYSFLSKGETWPPLVPLNAYQRYLIYLKFVEGKDILEIAKHLHKDRHIISKQLTKTINFVRRIANDKENSR